MDQPQSSPETRPKRREWTEAYARELFAPWKASELSVPAVAAQHGFHPDRFYRWRRKLEAAAPPASTRPRLAVVPWVPVCAVPAPAAAGFELELGTGRVLRIPTSFDPATLKA